MSEKYLIVNTGSASKKYAVYDKSGEIAFVHLETEEDGYISTLRIGNKSQSTKITEKNFNKSLEYLFPILMEKKIILGKEDITGVGIRVVAPGIYFQSHRIIDNKYVSNLKIAEKKAPLHLEMIFTELAGLKSFFGNKMKMVGVSDSAFHSTMSEKAKNYAINYKDAEKYEIYRYGYHGISAGSIVNKLEKKGRLPEKMIICHIGGGVSIMAVKDGKSIDTSMGFTPLEGMVMANRVGDIDSGAVVYISETLKLKGLKLLQYFNKKCGLLGLSGDLSNDIRDLFKAEEENADKMATKALDTYVYKIQKQIGAYYVALGGLDSLVFSGTVGERSYRMRKRICHGLKSLGIIIDEKINECIDGTDCVLNTNDSRVRIEVVDTDEMSQIAVETQKILV
jgi:acetate kinase